MSEGGRYGAFIPIDEKYDSRNEEESAYGDESSPLSLGFISKINAAFANLPGRIRNRDELISVRPIIGVAVYGIHSCDFVKLEALAEIALSSPLDGFPVHICDPKKAVRIEKSANELKELRTIGGLDNLHISFDSIRATDGTSMLFARYYPLYLSSDSNTDILLDKYHEAGLLTPFLRYAGMRAISRFTEIKRDYDDKLLFEYPAERILNTECFSDLVNSLTRLSISPAVIAIAIRFDGEGRNLYLTRNVVENLRKKTKATGIRFFHVKRDGKPKPI